MSARQFHPRPPRIGGELAVNWRHIRQFRQYIPPKGGIYNWRPELADGRNWRAELAEPGLQHISTIVNRIVAAAKGGRP